MSSELTNYLLRHNVLLTGTEGIEEQAHYAALMLAEKDEEIERITADNQRLLEALERVVYDMKHCDWSCEVCDHDYVMTDTDVYLTAKQALAATAQPQIISVDPALPGSEGTGILLNLDLNAPPLFDLRNKWELLKYFDRVRSDLHLSSRNVKILATPEKYKELVAGFPRPKDCDPSDTLYIAGLPIKVTNIPLPDGVKMAVVGEKDGNPFIVCLKDDDKPAQGGKDECK